VALPPAGDPPAQAQAEPMAPIDLISCLVSDELTAGVIDLLERRRKQADFRDAHKTLDNFDFTFNPKMNRSLVFDLALAASSASATMHYFAGWRTGKSHLAQASPMRHSAGLPCALREHTCWLDELAEAVVAGKRRQYVESLATVPLLHHRRFRNAQVALTAAKILLEIIMRRYERASTLLTSNRPVEDWGKLPRRYRRCRLDARRLLHHGHVLNVALAVGALKLPFPRLEVLNDLLVLQAQTGLRLGPKRKSNLPLSKTKGIRLPPLVGVQGCWSERNCHKFAQTGGVGVELFHVLSAFSFGVLR